MRLEQGNLSGSNKELRDVGTDLRDGRMVSRNGMGKAGGRDEPET